MMFSRTHCRRLLPLVMRASNAQARVAVPVESVIHLVRSLLACCQRDSFPRGVWSARREKQCCAAGAWEQGSAQALAFDDAHRMMLTKRFVKKNSGLLRKWSNWDFAEYA